MSDFASLNQAIVALTAQVENTVGTEASAVAFIQGFSTQIQEAVQVALTEDENADAASITAANQAIADVTARFAASALALGEAIVPATPPTPSERQR